YAVGAYDGHERWNLSTRWKDAVTTSPVVVDDVVYFGSDDNRLYAADAETGLELWNFPTYSEVYSTPAVANGLVYFGSDDSRLYAVYKNNGTECWNFSPSNHYIESSPAVADGVVYVGSWNARLYAVDALSGTERWNFTTGNSIYSSPAVVDGVVYVGSWDRKLYAIGGSAPSPVISTLTPKKGTIGTTVTITNLSGTGFLPGARVNLTRMGQANLPVSVLSLTPTKITGTVRLPGTIALGLWNVTIRNTDGKTGKKLNVFTVEAPPPAVTGITPKKGTRGTTVTITALSGTGFIPGAKATLTRTGKPDIRITITSLTSKMIRGTVKLPPSAATGYWNVTVRNTDGKSGTKVKGFLLRPA
ncbi:MAG: PQQ-binding-like beta-propeller repeat protein, partial [Methanoregulaceae archaeon]|nr:PQQ-binding-like beta-propeller repeat protein [Methanoregulaceae archaeon]